MCRSIDTTYNIAEKYKVSMEQTDAHYYDHGLHDIVVISIY